MFIKNKKNVTIILSSNLDLSEQQPCSSKFLSNYIVLVYRFEDKNGNEEYAVFSDYDSDTMADNTEEKDIVCLMASGMVTADGEIWLLEQE